MEVDEGGGKGEGPNEIRRLKRRSEDAVPFESKKSKKHWNKNQHCRRRKAGSWKKKKAAKKAKSIEGESTSKRPSSATHRKRRVTGSFNAPFNSTQFLMNDHAPDAVRNLESALNVKKGKQKRDQAEAVADSEDEESSVDYSLERPVRRITRARESSFSIDSDEDYYYSSPEDEEEFVNKEFIKDYDSVRNDRLVDMSKAELINEYLQMEQKIEALEGRLSNNEEKTITTKESMAATIKQFQSEIQRLESENSQLKIQKRVKKGNCSSCSSSSGSSSSEDSDDSSSDSSSSDDDSDNDDQEKVLMVKKTSEVTDDTGYESGQSHKQSKVANGGGLDPNEEKEVVVGNNGQEEISDNCITSTSP